MKKIYPYVLGLGLGIGILTNNLPLPNFIYNSNQGFVQAQETTNLETLENFTGNWQVRKTVHGEIVDESARETVYFTIIAEHLVGILDDTTLIDLTLTEPNQFTGKFTVFNFENKLPLEMKIDAQSSNNNQELNLQIKLTDIDLSKLGLTEEELTNLQELFAHDIYMSLEKMTPEKLAENDARSSLGMIARGEQVYYLEMNEFTDNLDLFALGFTKETDYYNFQISLINQDIVQLIAIPKIEGLKSYLAGIFAIPEDEFKSKYVICETENSTFDSDLLPTLENGELSCPSGFNVVDY